ncbi:YqcI/YcgG family protein [Frankia tisae]|uniref:YqcI/YcgG family protein n=1 Tax=Frankia tisae TaxID=2950104 RepID=UPI0021BFE319|nr:YqcI/YcgG family protein [Frankia tisae]
MSASITDSYREEVLDLAIGPVPEWGEASVLNMMATLQSDSEPFPCVFAVAASRRGGLRFGFVDDLHDERTWSRLPEILASYLAVYQTLSQDTSLIVFFGTGPDREPDASPAHTHTGTGTVAKEEQEEEQDAVLRYERRFWSLLQYLHDNDGDPWPSDIPTDTDDPGWEFSFRGTPIFVVCNTPAHRRLRSRSNPVYTLTFQPRWVFEGLGAQTPRGATARRIIRERLRRMDSVDSIPMLGSYGDPDNREWKQYFLRDDASVADGCPFHTGTGRPTGRRPVAQDRFKVVVNDELQFSVWPEGRRNALGWFDAGVAGSRQECLDRIEQTWTDLRPRSLRRTMAGSAGRPDGPSRGTAGHGWDRQRAGSADAATAAAAREPVGVPT